MRFRFALLVLSFFASEFALASIPGLAPIYTRELLGTQALLSSQGLLNQPVASNCRMPGASSQEVRMVFVFGYMDVSSNPDYRDSSTAAYGVGAVLDQDARAAFESVLQMPCPSSRGVRACGFTARGGRLEKSIQDRSTGRRVKISIQTASSSASSSDRHNQGAGRSQQERQTRLARQTFEQGLRSADVVAYMGHARSGGGPDFAPPRLRSGGGVDYASYIREQAGISMTLSALAGRTKPGVVALLACRSTPLFADRLRLVAKGSTFVTANQLFDYNRILPSALALVEASMAPVCGKALERVVGQAAGSGMIRVF